MFGSIILVDTEVLNETIAMLMAVFGILVTLFSFYFSLVSTGDDDVH